jgi:hypothetical protein
MSQIEKNMRKLLTMHKTVLRAGLKRKLTPYHSKPPHLYRLLKIHKPDIPFRPTVSSNDSPYSALAEFLYKVLSPLASNVDSFMKDSEQFIKLIQDINLQNKDNLVSSDVSLFTNIPVEEVLQVLRNRLNTDLFFPRTPLQFEDIMGLLDICLTATYFQFEDKFYQQKEGMAMGNTYLRGSVTYFWNILRKYHWIQQTKNPLNGSDTSMTLSWFGHMDQQDCSSFFTISTAYHQIHNGS